MGKAKEKYYDSETGEVLDPQQEQRTSIEPVRIPGIVGRFMSTYIPAVDERHADEVLSIGELRTLLSCWFQYGASEDVLQGYLDELYNNGYRVIDTASGPALCVVRRNSTIQVNDVYEELDEL